MTQKKNRARGRGVTDPGATDKQRGLMSRDSISRPIDTCQASTPSPGLRASILEYTHDMRQGYFDALAKHSPQLAANRAMLYVYMLTVCHEFGIDPLEGAAP